jgi:hypothetical protein
MGTHTSQYNTAFPTTSEPGLAPSFGAMYVRRMLADRAPRRQGAERAAARGGEPLGRVHFRLRYYRSSLERARPRLQSCLAEALFAACTRTAPGAVVGIAKLDSLAYTVAQTGFKGTPASMSPEQLKVPHAPRPSVALHGVRRSCCTDEFTLCHLRLRSHTRLKVRTRCAAVRRRRASASRSRRTATRSRR